MLQRQFYRHYSAIFSLGFLRFEERSHMFLLLGVPAYPKAAGKKSTKASSSPVQFPSHAPSYVGHLPCQCPAASLFWWADELGTRLWEARGDREGWWNLRSTLVPLSHHPGRVMTHFLASALQEEHSRRQKLEENDHSTIPASFRP